jgi:hypothetical protein
MVDGALAGSSGTGAAEVAVPASASIHRPRHADKAAARARSAQAETKPSANAGSANEPLAALRARIAREPERWRWQRAAEPGASHAAQPVADALQRWLAGLDRSSASGWQAASGDADAGAGNAALGDTAGALRLTRDGVLQATMGFNRSGVWLETAGAAGAAAAQFQFRLPSASIDALRSSLHDALREPAR